MTEHTSQQDISFLRAMAERGSRAPLLGGRYLVFWGLLIAAAYGGHYAVLAGRTPFGPEALGVLWAGFGLAAGVGMTVLSRTFPSKPGASSFGNLIEREVWRMVGAALTTYVLGALAAVALGRVGFEVMDTILPVALLFYAVAFATAGRAAEIGWFKLVALASFVLSAIACLLIGTAELYLFGAVSVLLVGFVPGLILLRGEPPAAPAEEE